MTYRVKFLPEAASDLTATISYINENLKNPVAANNLYTGFREAIQLLSVSPHICQICYSIRKNISEIRRCSVGNYHIFYRIDEKEKIVFILRIISSRRDFSCLFESTK